MNRPAARPQAFATASSIADPVAALERHAERTPEAPCLFFRDPRGHFRWWSWVEARAVIAAPAGAALDAGAAAARDYLAAALARRDAARAGASEWLAALGGAVRRDIWLTRGELATPAAAAVAVAAVIAGWAVVHEPAAAIHPSTFLWARPTIVVGGAAELEHLLTGCVAQAPSWRRRPWLARRLRRLRAVVVTDAGEPRTLALRLADLGASARVLSNVGGRMVETESAPARR